MPSAELQPTDVLHRPPLQRLERHRSVNPALRRRQKGVDRRTVNPILSKIVEVRVKPFEEDVRSIAQAVVDRACESAAIAKVPIVAKVGCPDHGRAWPEVG